MARLMKVFAGTLASGVLIAIAWMPAQAEDLGVSVGGISASIGDNGGQGLGVDGSIGGRNGINADVDIGASRGADVGATASVGGSGGVNADIGASVGGGVDVGATASVGGGGGVNADVGVGVGGNGVDLGVGIGIGGGTLTPGVPPVARDPGRDDPGKIDRPGTSTGKTDGRNSVASTFGMSGAQLARLSKRCVDVLSDPSSYDRDLISLCRTIRGATR